MRPAGEANPDSLAGQHQAAIAQLPCIQSPNDADNLSNRPVAQDSIECLFENKFNYLRENPHLVLSGTNIATSL
jgi:hypothetical protein